MKIYPKYLKIINVIGILFILFLGWYKFTFSMRTAQTYEVKDPLLENKVLIATQKSVYKDSLVQSVIKAFEEDSIYFKIIDIKSLVDENVSNYDALLVLCTVEYWKLPKEVHNFIQSRKHREKLLVMNTSGGGDFLMLDVDGISGASELTNIISFTSQLEAWIQGMVN